jgi:hypothetical protein
MISSAAQANLDSMMAKDAKSGMWKPRTHEAIADPAQLWPGLISGLTLQAASNLPTARSLCG